MSSSKLPSLPFELVKEILYRVPIKSLERLKTICKQWYTLFNDKRFIYKSFDLSKDKRFIQVYHRSIHLFKLEPEALLRLRIPAALRKKSFTEAIHCDGLLLVLLSKSRKLAVWNPFLRRVKLIKLSSSYTTHDIYGFGYDNVSRDNYKILRIKTPNHTQGESLEIEIYDFKCKLWRSVDATLECDLIRLKHVSMIGNMYWIARAKMVNSEIEIFIQSFDFSTETFKPICCVPHGTDCYPENCKHMILSGFGGDRLSLLHQHNNQKIEVWITNKVSDGIVSWSRFFNVDCPGRHLLHSKWSFPTYYTHKPNTIMLWCEEILDDIRIFASVYEMDEGEINKLVVLRCRGRLCNYYDISCNVYAPSLVPVPE